MNLPSYAKFDHEPPPVDSSDETPTPESPASEPPASCDCKDFPAHGSHTADCAYIRLGLHTRPGGPAWENGFDEELTIGIGRRDPRLLAIRADARWLTRFLALGTGAAFLVSLYAVLLYAVQAAYELTYSPWLAGARLFLILFGLLVAIVVIVAAMRYEMRRRSRAGGR